MTQETFSDITRAMSLLNIATDILWEINISPIEPSAFLQLGLQRARKQITFGANEWEHRLFMELFFLEALENHSLRMWQEKSLDAGQSPFRGKVDFIFTPYQIKFQRPYLVLSEAKKENFEQGWGQCLLAMKTCQLLNAQASHAHDEPDLYGIVSTGRIWEFGKLTTTNQFYKTDGYTLAQPDLLLGALDHVFTLSEQALI